MKPALLKKFFKGECTPEEVHEIWIWINSDKGVQDLEEEMERFEAANPSMTEVPSKMMLERINAHILEEEKDSLIQRKSAKIAPFIHGSVARPWYKKWFTMAASVGLVIMVSMWWILFHKESKVEQQKPSLALELVTKTTPYGQKLKLMLADGTHVHLNAGSKLVFPRRFDDGVRSVYLEGEAFFDVSRDENWPFEVKTHHATTQVLGTSFVVRDLPDQKNTKVGVLTGKVKVTEKAGREDAAGEGSFLLLPMEGVAYSAEEGALSKFKFEYDEMFAWKDNVIHFKMASFNEVTGVLTRWFGKEFEVRKGFTSKKDFTGKFDNQSLDHILEGLSFTFGFHYRIEDKKVIIY